MNAAHMQYYYESGKDTGDTDVYVSAISYNENENCGNTIRSAPYKPCLSIGYKVIFGAFRVNCLRTCRRDLQSAATGAKCKGKQFADVYHVSMPDGDPKPYSAEVMDFLIETDAIDWNSHTFKMNKLSEVEDILNRHGNGLNGTQASVLNRLGISNMAE